MLGLLSFDPSDSSRLLKSFAGISKKGDEKEKTHPMARILLAEDDESMRGFLLRALVQAGHQVVAAENGREALSYLVAGRFDLLLTDIAMPALDGVTLARHAAEIAPEMRVVFITGFAAVALAEHGGPERETPPVLSKPFHLKDVVAAIERLCAA